MLNAVLKRIFSSHNERHVRRCYKIVDRINALESAYEALTDEALRNKTVEFKERLLNGETEDDLLPEAFAVVREGAKRVFGMRHFDVQMIGGIILHQGRIAEMATGEGKTLVATLPVYLNALCGKGVHVVTVNDYLAKRDAEWMGQLYTFLGLTVGYITGEISVDARRDIYNRDIVYGTNNEFGFDFLRDNLKFEMTDLSQRAFHYAIVDEVDSILIDEARTPLIISGPAEDSSALYVSINKVIPLLEAGIDYEVDEKQKSVVLTEDGNDHVEDLLRQHGILAPHASLYDIENVACVHHIHQALRAHVLFHKDIDYIVQDNKVIIIDEFTGRMMDGRRYSDGLHQALEAKEGVKIQLENQTLASITFQNYFRMYPKLSGMTGTGATEAQEFEEIYKLQVINIPTNRPIQRKDHQDEVYRTSMERDIAVLKQIEACRAKGQPVLVGTTSIERSEVLAKLLKSKKIPHSILNAKQHDREAHIIAQAGAPGSVTIATNMAGRGTDIQLGGNLDMLLEDLSPTLSGDARRQEEEKIKKEIEFNKSKVLEAGGLYVIGTERHESRRIDNQLRGRSGRQGDPGDSKFYVSLEDDLMRIFGSARMDTMLQRMGLGEGEAIIHPWVSKAIERAQKKVEERNFDIRKQLLKFDDVVNDQRHAIFDLRKDILSGDGIKDRAYEMRQEVLEDIVAKHIPMGTYVDRWDVEGLREEILSIFGLTLDIPAWAAEEGVAEQEILDRLREKIDVLMAKKEQTYGAAMMHLAMQRVMLQVLDHVWKEHLLQLDHLRQGIGLRAYAQQDPLNEYKHEGFLSFERMLKGFFVTTTQMLAMLEISAAPSDEAKNAHGGASVPSAVITSADDAPEGWVFMETLGYYVDPENQDTWGKVQRNAVCPCGSGKKFKHCHGVIV